MAKQTWLKLSRKSLGRPPVGIDIEAAYQAAKKTGDIQAMESIKRTKQEFKDQCDINKIVAKHPDLNAIQSAVGRTTGFGDLSTMPKTLLEAETQIANAHQAFMELPSTVRRRFENDPSNLMAFLADKTNKDEAIGLGLIPDPKTAPKTLGDVIDAVKSATQAPPTATTTTKPTTTT